MVLNFGFRLCTCVTERFVAILDWLSKFQCKRVWRKLRQKFPKAAPAEPFRLDNREAVVVLSLVISLEYWTSSCVNLLMAPRLSCEQIFTIPTGVMIRPVFVTGLKRKTQAQFIVWSMTTVFYLGDKQQTNMGEWPHVFTFLQVEKTGLRATFLSGVCNIW